jgi:hypothetical protein
MFIPYRKAPQTSDFQWDIYSQGGGRREICRMMHSPTKSGFKKHMFGRHDDFKISRVSLQLKNKKIGCFDLN